MVVNTQTINTRLVLLGLILGMFFSALEQTIVGTAMPTIIADLQGFEIFAWVTTAYLITSTVVVPIVSCWLTGAPVVSSCRSRERGSITGVTAPGSVSRRK